jgi:hypothetical protein
LVGVGAAAKAEVVVTVSNVDVTLMMKSVMNDKSTDVKLSRKFAESGKSKLKADAERFMI